MWGALGGIKGNIKTKHMYISQYGKILNIRSHLLLFISTKEWLLNIKYILKNSTYNYIEGCVYVCKNDYNLINKIEECYDDRLLNVYIYHILKKKSNIINIVETKNITFSILSWHNQPNYKFEILNVFFERDNNKFFIKSDISNLILTIFFIYNYQFCYDMNQIIPSYKFNIEIKKLDFFDILDVYLNNFLDKKIEKIEVEIFYDEFLTMDSLIILPEIDSKHDLNIINIL